jgi:TRAP-type C4-dicarboxylate transport system substrate-binding protein
MGASAVSMDPGDYYISLERGVVDGIITGWAADEAFKLYEVAKTNTIFGDGDGGLWSPGFGVIINLDTWNKLPEEYRELLTQVFDEAGDNMALWDVDTEAYAKEESKKRGKVVQLTNEEREAWVAYMIPANEKWISDTAAKGWPAQKAFDRLMELLQEAND